MPSKFNCLQFYCLSHPSPFFISSLLAISYYSPYHFPLPLPLISFLIHTFSLTVFHLTLSHPIALSLFLPTSPSLCIHTPLSLSATPYPSLSLPSLFSLPFLPPLILPLPTSLFPLLPTSQGSHHFQVPYLT